MSTDATAERDFRGIPPTKETQDRVAAIREALDRLLFNCPNEDRFGEFGVVFTRHNGQISDYQIVEKRRYKR